MGSAQDGAGLVPPTYADDCHGWWCGLFQRLCSRGAMQRLHPSSTPGPPSPHVEVGRLQVSEKTKSADRVLGNHFFSPAHVMPLLEIVRTDRTSPQARPLLLTGASGHLRPPAGRSLRTRCPVRATARGKRGPAAAEPGQPSIGVRKVQPCRRWPALAGHPGHHRVRLADKEDPGGRAQLHWVCRQPRVLPLHPGTLAATPAWAPCEWDSCPADHRCRRRAPALHQSTYACRLSHSDCGHAMPRHAGWPASMCGLWRSFCMAGTQQQQQQAGCHRRAHVLQAACMLLDLGVDPYTVDKAIQFGFGMPMGPFRWAHTLGCLCQARRRRSNKVRDGEWSPCACHASHILLSALAASSRLQWPAAEAAPPAQAERPGGRGHRPAHGDQLPGGLPRARLQVRPPGPGTCSAAPLCLPGCMCTC